MKYLTHIRIIAVAFVLVVATFLPSAAQTTTIHRVVASPMGATQDGTSWENAMTLQAALAISGVLDQVWIAGGTYKPHADDRAETFSIPGRRAQVYGGFAGTEDDDFDPATNDTRLRNADGTFINETILSGDLAGDDLTDRKNAGYAATRTDNSYTVVTIKAADVVLNGLTITSGERGTPSFGGGLYSNSSASNISVTACTFTNNRASTAGGGAFFSQAATLTDCTFTGNSRSGAQFAAAATLTGCTFTNNTRAGNGGGAFFNQAATLTDCTFTDNTGSGRGGGAYFTSTAIATLTDCIFTDNEAIIGGGAYFLNQAATLTSCAFTSNEATRGDGGGVYFFLNATLTGCVFTSNEATSGDGGGAYFSRKAALTNCVYANNTATAQGGGIGLSAGGTVINSTFYNNTATSLGGGIRVRFGDADASMSGTQTVPFILQNSLFVNNTSANDRSGHQVYVSNGSENDIQIQNNLIEGGATGIGYMASGATGITEVNTLDEPNATVVFASTTAADPNFLRLVAASPAANAGNNDYLNNGTPADTDDDITLDAVGADRIQGGTVDLGAYESDIKVVQTIDFMLAGTGTVGDKPDLVATSDSGLPVTFTSSDETVATIGMDTDAGKLVLKAEGTATITASQAGNDTYEAATAMQTITVGPVVPPTAQTIMFASSAAGQTNSMITLTATATSMGAVTYAITEVQDADGNVVTGTAANAVATLMGTTLTLSAAGTVAVTASQAGGDINGTIYAPATQTQTITVTDMPPTVQTIAFTSPAEGPMNSTITLVATATSMGTVTFAITEVQDADGNVVTGGDADAVATLAGTTLTLGTPGTVTITASQTGGDISGTIYAATTQTQVITVTTPQTITFDSSATGPANSMITLVATATSMGTVTFAITEVQDTDGNVVTGGDADAVATLAGTTLTLAAEGTVTVTASQAGGDISGTIYAATTQTQVITITVSSMVLGIEDAVDGFVLYPNPTSGKLHFSEQVAEFRLYGIEGRLLETRKNVRSADLSARPAGLYFVEVVRDGRSLRWRILRE